MSYRVELTPQTLLHLDRHKRTGNKRFIAKIADLMAELAEHPRTGTGKPERLKNYTREIWFRRIDQKHRLVYEIQEHELVVVAVAAYGHYDED